MKINVIDYLGWKSANVIDLIGIKCVGWKTLRGSMGTTKSHNFSQ